MTTIEDDEPRLRQSHIFKREELSHYVDPPWCSERLFAVERFEGHIVDPACGWGTIVIAALSAGHAAAGFDLVNRGWDSTRSPSDFLKSRDMYDNIVSNPPFEVLDEFIIKAVDRSRHKTAMIFPLRRLPAARFLERLPLAHIRLLTPRPSMPPGEYIRAGGKVGGGTQDFCWLIFERGLRGYPQMSWLHRDGDAA